MAKKSSREVVYGGDMLHYLTTMLILLVVSYLFYRVFFYDEYSGASTTRRDCDN